MWNNNIALYIARYDTAIWIRVIGTMLSSLTTFMIRPFLVLYLYDQLEGSILLPMLIVGLQPLSGAIVNLAAGNLSDRYGRKPVMMAALLVQALCMLGFMLANNVWEYAAISILNGAGFAMFMPAANAQISDVISANRRAEVFALLHTAFNIGAAIGPAVGLLLFSWNSQTVFFISAVTMLVYLLLVWIKVGETLPAEAKTKNNRLARKPRINWPEHKFLYLITLLSIPAGLLYAQVETTFPLHLKTHFDSYKSVLASLLTFNGIMVILMQIWIARKTETMAPYKVIGFSYLVFAFVAVGYGYVPVIALLFVVEFVFTIGEMLNGPHIQKVVSLIATAENRGWYFSVFGISHQISRAVGPMLGGLLFTAGGGKFMFTLLSILLVISGLLQVAVIRAATKRDASTATHGVQA